MLSTHEQFLPSLHPDAADTHTATAAARPNLAPRIPPPIAMRNVTYALDVYR